MVGDIHLDVPFITQMKVGAHAGGNYFNDTTGCWYAGICMLAYYQAPGPRMGVPSQYSIPKLMRDQSGALTNEQAVAARPMGANYAELKSNEGLESIALPAEKRWSCAQLGELLANKGPLFVRRGFRRNGALVGGHIIVLVGSKVSTRRVLYHCPTAGPDQSMTIDEFNDVFKWDDARAAEYSMMYKPKRGPGKSVKELAKFFGG